MEVPPALNTTSLDVQQLQDLALGLGIGGAIGVMTGVAFKYTARKVLFAMGVVFIAIQTLQFFGFIDVRWDKITESALPVFDANRDGVLDEADARYMIQHAVELAPEILSQVNVVNVGWNSGLVQGLPNLTGFASGLLMAFWLF